MLRSLGSWMRSKTCNLRRADYHNSGNCTSTLRRQREHTCEFRVLGPLGPHISASHMLTCAFLSLTIQHTFPLESLPEPHSCAARMLSCAS